MKPLKYKNVNLISIVLSSLNTIFQKKYEYRKIRQVYVLTLILRI